MKRFTLLATGLLLLGAGSALAQTDYSSSSSTYRRGASDFYVGAGYSAQTNTGAPSGSIAAQGGINYMASPGFGIGAMAGYYVLGKNTFNTGTTSSSTTYSLIPVTGQLSYMFATNSTFKPYLDAGAGVYFTRVSNDPGGSSSDNRLGLNGGVGFEILSGSTGYGLDAKYHVMPKRNSETESGKVLSAMATVHFH